MNCIEIFGPAIRGAIVGSAMGGVLLPLVWALAGRVAQRFGPPGLFVCVASSASALFALWVLGWGGC